MLKRAGTRNISSLKLALGRLNRTQPLPLCCHPLWRSAVKSELVLSHAATESDPGKNRSLIFPKKQ